MRRKLELIWEAQMVFKISKFPRAEAKACIPRLVTVKRLAIPREYDNFNFRNGLIGLFR